MMLEIEVFVEKSRFCRILDCHNSPGKLELAMASWDQKLTRQARHGEFDSTTCVVDSSCGPQELFEARSCSLLLNYEPPQF